MVQRHVKSPWSASPRRRGRRRRLLGSRLLREGIFVAAIFLGALVLGRLNENDFVDALFAALDRGFQMDIATPLIPAGSMLPGGLPMCGGGQRISCLVDGDTGWARGTKWRLAAIDAPEAFSPACAAEKRAADRATRRLQSLLSSGYRLDATGRDRYGRELVTITLSDGRDAGRVLMAEGLAQGWPNRGNPWCSG